MLKSGDLPDKNFDYCKIINKIIDVESKYSVFDSKWKGLYLWPFFRLVIWSELQRIENSRNELQEDAGNKKQKKIAYKKYWAIIICSLQLKFIRAKIKFLKLIKNKKLILFFSNEVYYQSKTVKGRLDVHLDPLVDICNQVKIPNLKIKDKSDSSLNEYHERPLFLNVKIFKKLFKYHIYKNNMSPALLLELEKYQGIVQKEIDLNLGDAFAKKLHFEITFYYWLYEKYLRGLGTCVEAIFANCYYSVNTMVLFYVASINQIKTVDVQHGKQGSPHAMYSHWGNLPESGCGCLPNYFWNWGAESANSINMHLSSEVKSTHKAIIGGYPRIEYYNNGIYEFKYSDKEKEFLKKLKSADRTIIYSMQPFNEISDFVFDGMAKTSGTLWLVRMHPSSTTSEKLNLDNSIKERQLSNVEIECASSLDLYELLSKADVHITRWSSVCFEAELFGVPTIIVDEIGYKLYEKNILEGSMSYSKSVSSLLETIMRPKYINSKYIQTDIDKSKVALLNIYNSVY